MATGQIALARHRTPTLSMNRPRSQVPAFLQKLHEMVNDPNNHELIRWSDAGDSFYVLDHERFAREVLGRWFKHQNFASFVRQLNMYGFHKIPHLQQGVLKSDTDTEFWNFAHPNFVRGHPDLLALIQRKKQINQGAPGSEGAGDAIMDLQRGDASSTGTTVNGATSSANGNAPSPNANNQVMDIQTIVSGITAIKRHQAAISEELNDLKRSNQMLWQDAMDAREKHQKQQDTINRIVKFLAGVFGSRAGGGMGHHKDVDGNVDVGNQAIVPRRVSRFLIEDGRGGQSGGKVRVEDIDEDMEDDKLHFSIPEYPIIETPSYNEPPSPAPSDTSVPSTILGTTPSSEHPPPHDILQPNPTQHQFPPFTVAVSAPSATQPKDSTPAHPQRSQPQPVTSQQQTHTDATDRAITPVRSPSNLDFDPRVQTFLNQLTPVQIQQLLSNLNSMDPISTADHNSNNTGSGSSSANNYNQQVMQYTQPMDWSQLISNTPSLQNVPGGVDSLLSFDDHDHDDHSSSAPSGDLSRYTNDLQSQRIARDWKAAEDIDRDVNAMSTDIESFIRDLGLDPSTIDHTGGMGTIDDAMSDDGHDHATQTQDPVIRSTTSGMKTSPNIPTSIPPAGAGNTGNTQDSTLFDINSLLWDHLDSSNLATTGLSGLYGASPATAEAFANSGLDPAHTQTQAPAAQTHSRNSSSTLQPPANIGVGAAGYEGNKRKSLDLSDSGSVSGMSTTGSAQTSPVNKGTKRRKKAN